MIFCETGGTESADFDSLVVFASQARAHGLPVVVSEQSIPAGIGMGHQFDVSSFLSHSAPSSDDHVVLLAANRADAVRVGQLRDRANGATLSCLAFGAFETRQSEITVASRLAYAFHREPTLIRTDGIAGLPAANAPIFGAPLAKAKRDKPTVGLFFPDLETGDARPMIRALALSQHFNIEIVTTGAAKKKWIDADGYNIRVWHLGELLPRAMAARFDVAVFFAEPMAWSRFQMLFANMALAGTALIDATLARSWHSQMPDVIAGPARLADLSDWLCHSILPNAERIAHELKHSELASKLTINEPLMALSTPIKRKLRKVRRADETILFIPTNGVGLGHAKRCSLVADAMRDRAKAQFAAFPSCIGMLTASGFDTMPLVSRTPHRASHDNDVINFARVSSLTKHAAVAVFDGGYVFDSIMRSAADSGKPSVWIRRGLWQASQNNQIALDRQKAFTRIVVPTEAFDELNAPAETNANVVQVGPIVQCNTMTPGKSADLRANLLNQLGLKGTKLVVTMLGGGVAADRRAQINAICSHLADQDDIAHLLVVWPTATTDPGWFHYANTRVVQSIHASALIPLADLFVSAIGYNSFHEALYGQVPTIFVPQMASYMDDQRARGRAAAERDLAVLVEPWELLSLTRAIDECLGGKSDLLRENLRGLNLPEPGTHDAAKCILEVAQ